MSIFKHSTEVQEPTATAIPAGSAASQPDRRTKLTPPFAGAVPRTTAAAGVVPPQAAPIYSMQPAPRAESDGDGAAMANSRVASEPQQPALPAPASAAPAQPAKAAALPAPAMRRQAAPRQAPAIPQPVQPPTRQQFDPARAAQAGLLNLAWSWQQAGSPIRAIHTYMELLARYPGSPAAAGAIADLVQLSSKLAEQGNFHTALSIFDDLEELQRGCDEW